MIITSWNLMGFLLGKVKFAVGLIDSNAQVLVLWAGRQKIVCVPLFNLLNFLPF